MSPSIYPHSYIRREKKVKKTRKPEYILVGFILIFLIL